MSQERPEKKEDKERKLTRNAVKCLKCNDVIESVHRHDFRYCTCGNIAVDGGLDYLRRVGSFDDVEDMSEWEEDVASDPT